MSVSGIDVERVWWRHMPHGADPWFRADPPSDGRWQRGEMVGGMYFADSEQTAWAEWYRALAEYAILPQRQMPRDLWRWRIDVDSLAPKNAFAYTTSRIVHSEGPGPWADDLGLSVLAAASSRAILSRASRRADSGPSRCTR